jgi:UDP-3-O-[3-hydroxymyristoyl] glucosamine N-acyltransferase
MKTREIAELVGGELVGNGDAEISGVASLQAAGPTDLAFADGGSIPDECSAGCLLVPAAHPTDAGFPHIRVADPKFAFAVAASRIVPRVVRRGWHPTAVVAGSADIRASFVGAFVSIGEGSCVGEEAEIGDGVRIGRNVSIGKHTVVHSNAVIHDNVRIGGECVIHAGAVIGADGFGYVRGAEGYVQFPQIGRVVIEDRVEIGANTCIDRGALGETRIGEGTKIDNLVQIAHNVTIGKRVVIAALSGISGSSVIGDDCVLAGQVGIADHVRLMPGAVIGAKSSVFPGKVVRPGVWCGTPVQPIDDYKRQNALVKGLVRLREEVKELKRRLGGNSA